MGLIESEERKTAKTKKGAKFADGKRRRQLRKYKAERDSFGW